MAEIALIYTGPLFECGFTGPVSGRSYVARPNEPFVVDPVDSDRLLAKWPGLLKLSEPVQEYKRRYARLPAQDDQETRPAERDGDQESES